VVAVGSRRQESANEFAREHSIARAYPSYDQLVSDAGVDVVYVATPHPGHHDAAMLAIEAGKAVLVEKPFTMDATEADSLVSAARTRGIFLMEAMWARFLPHVVQVRELLAAGALGDLRLVIADHCQWIPGDPSHRLLAPELGGGALLDLGIYPVSFASMVLGTPTSVTAVSDPASTGVDATTSVLLQHDGAPTRSSPRRSPRWGPTGPRSSAPTHGSRSTRCSMRRAASRSPVVTAPWSGSTSRTEDGASGTRPSR